MYAKKYLISYAEDKIAIFSILNNKTFAYLEREM